MKLKDLVDKYTIDDIWNDVKSYDGDVHSDRKLTSEEESIIKNNYSNLLKELKSIKPDESSNITIQIKRVVDDIIPEETEEYDSVDGYLDGNKEEVRGLMLLGWEKWLASEIDEEVFKNYTETNALVMILWEMTWFGFSKDGVDNKVREIEEADYTICELDDEEC